MPSPSSDLFLVQVSQIIGPCFDIIPMLGIGNDKLESMKQGVSPETVMLKVSSQFCNTSAYYLSLNIRNT